jgi:hypothetical protein
MDSSYRAIDTMSKADLKRVIYSIDAKSIHHDLTNNHMDERDNHTTDIDRLVGGYSWEHFLNDTDEAVMTGAHVAHGLLPLFGLGRKVGGRVEPNYSQGEPVQNLTLQHLRDKHKDIYSPLGVLLSQYTPPDQMRDQSVRPDMPLDQTEVIKPPPPPPPPKPMTEWQAFKKGFTLPFRAVGAVLGLGHPEPTPELKIGGKRPPNKWIQHVKNYASKHNINYRDALKDPKCRASYNK